MSETWLDIDSAQTLVAFSGLAAAVGCHIIGEKLVKVLSEGEACRLVVLTAPE